MERVTDTEVRDRESSAEYMNRLLDDGIKPHVFQLSRIISDGDVAVVLFEPCEEAKEAATELGWDGQSHVFRMSNRIRRRYIEILRKKCPEDKITPRWLDSKNIGRIFCLVTKGSLLVNLDFGRGYSIEPGSLDREWMN